MSALSDFIKSRKQQKEQSKNVQKEKLSKDWLSWIPLIALVVGNLIVLAGELRVFDVVLKLTNSLLLATTALLGTGLMFILWFDVLHQYRLRTDGQKKISLVFSILSLIMGGFFAFADYAYDPATGTVLGFSPDFLWGSIVIVTVANAIALFYWHEIDPRVQFERTAAENEASDLQEEQEYAGYERSLERRESLLNKHEGIKAQYGEDALNETIEEHGNRKQVKAGKQKQPSFQPANQFASGAPAIPVLMPQGERKQEEVTNLTLKDLERVSKLEKSGIQGMFTEYDKFAAWCRDEFDKQGIDISGKNMKRIWYQELGKANPSDPAPRQIAEAEPSVSETANMTGHDIASEVMTWIKSLENGAKPDVMTRGKHFYFNCDGTNHYVYEVDETRREVRKNGKLGRKKRSYVGVMSTARANCQTESARWEAKHQCHDRRGNLESVARLQDILSLWSGSDNKIIGGFVMTVFPIPEGMTIEKITKTNGHDKVFSVNGKPIVGLE